MSELREKIDYIVNSGNFSINDHAIEMEKIKQEFPHSVACIMLPTDLPRCNCFMYALGLVGSKIIEQIIYDDYLNDCKLGVMFDSKFIDRLINKGILIQNNEGSVIVYFDGDFPKHAGRVENEQIVSKWGIGCLWKHGLWEVPVSYGGEHKKFDVPNRNLVEEEFKRYFDELGQNYLLN